MKILNFILQAFLNGGIDSPITTVIGALFLAGLWGIFQKCGLKGWWALIPVVRDYKLGLCAGRESEGRMAAVLSAISLLLSIPAAFVTMNDTGSTFLLLPCWFL